MNWTPAEAIDLCRLIESLCPAFGCHVALTGGLLYKDGERKDADILFYRIRDVHEIDIKGLFKALEAIGVKLDADQDADEYGEDLWCLQATWSGKPVDFFFPEWADTNSDAASGPGVEAVTADIEF